MPSGAAGAASAGSTLMGAYGSVASGNLAAAAGDEKLAAAQGEQQAANYQAAALTQQAGQDRAASQRRAELQNQNTALAISRSRALAAASGGTASDISVVNNNALIAGRGEFNAASELYAGEEKARGAENQAALDIYQGQEALAAGQFEQQAGQERQTLGYINAASTVLGSKSTSTLLAKYG